MAEDGLGGRVAGWCGEVNYVRHRTPAGLPRQIFLLTAVLVTMLWPGVGIQAGHAQVAASPALPGSVQPGAVERSLQNKLPAPAQDRVSIPAPQGFEPPAGAAGFRFTLHAVTITGAQALGDAALRSSYAALLGKDITLADLYGVARAITDLYSRRGYALSFAMVPAQEIDKARGDVRIEVIEGYIDNVRYNGRTSPVAEQYGAAITRSRPLRTADIERALLLMNDLPGTTARGVFQHDDSLPVGSARLDVLTDTAPVTANVQIDNRGTAAFGPWRAFANLGLNDVLGHGESLNLTGLKALNANALNFGSARASLPVGGDGWMLSADATYTDAHPGTPLLTSAGFASSGWTASLSASDPVLRGRDESLWLWGGVEAKWLRSDLASAPNSRDHIYGLQAGAIWNRRDDSGVTAANLTLTQGLPVFGATGRASALRSRGLGSGTFTDVLASVARQQEIGGNFELYLAGSGQFASRGLLAPEQCGYGGSGIGRGFDANEIVGDHCLQGLVELRYNAPVTGGFLTHLQPYVSYDAGAVWNDGPAMPGAYGSAAADSTAVGLRAGVLNRFDLALEYALPIGRDVALEGNRDSRVFLTLGVTL
jgi:hemolysin activation/secretion protein